MATPVFTSTADIENHFISSQNNKDENNWSDGDALIAALELQDENGKPVYTSLKSLYFDVLAPIVQDSYSTVNNQWRTSVIFPDDKRADEKCWSVHQKAARAVKRITRVEDYQLAWNWLDRAIAENLTTDGLADAMAGSKADVHKDKPVYLCKRVPAEVCSVTELGNDTSKVVLHIDRETGNDLGVALGMYGLSAVLLTMFIPAQVDNVNSEAEAA